MAPAPALAPVPGLVHDYLLVLRGAERTFAEIADCFPQAPIYTLLYDPAAVASRFAGRTVRTSSLQHLHVRQSSFRALLPLMPSAAERLPVQGHELVVSSSSAFAHGVRPGEGAVHVCYCHTPFRYAWHERRWDLEASSRVTRYIANSEICRRRIDELWHRDASVVHPPVETHRFHIGEPEDFFLVVTELVPHKRVDTALEAARRAGRPIKVVGGGPDRERLAARYADTAQFLGRISDSELEELYPRARALMVPSVEEFGITAVEAQASGRPVVASAAGGARETVIDGTTGVLVPPGDVDAFADAIRNTNFEAFSPHRIKRYAERFSTRVFRRKFLSEVAGAADRDVSVHAGIGEASAPSLRAT